MTNEEKFMFDLEGYLVIKNVLTPDEVAEMNEIADGVFPRKEGDAANHRTSRVSLWGEPFKRLIDHPTIVPYLIELIGPKFRLDHDYCIFMVEGATGGGLHGGEDGGRPGGNEGDHWYKYRDGVMRNGLSVVTFFLTDAAEGDGGFACIPGSHKSNCLSGIPPEVRRFEHRTHYVVQPAVEAGDALLESRKLDHDEAVEFLGALEYPVAPAAREHLRAVFREDRRHAVGVFLVLDGIVDPGAGDPVGGHGVLHFL